MNNFKLKKVNSVFRWIAELNSISGLNEKGQNGVDSILSNYVGMIGQVSNFLIAEIDSLKQLQKLFCQTANASPVIF